MPCGNMGQKTTLDTIRVYTLRFLSHKHSVPAWSEEAVSVRFKMIFLVKAGGVEGPFKNCGLWPLFIT